jgi:CheY-like chemotaxis protein
MARILFVDDEIDTLTTLKKGVEIFGHEAMVATDGLDAVRLAADRQPDLIFLDMRLAGVDGLEIVRLLRQEAATASIPVVMLSAGPELDAADLAYHAGVQEYLLKPVRLQTLLDVIAAYQPGAET